jgi:hypothetical protein
MSLRVVSSEGIEGEERTVEECSTDDPFCSRTCFVLPAAKAYENHVAANGKPASHALAKELFAAYVSLSPPHRPPLTLLVLSFAGAEADSPSLPYPTSHYTH